MRYHLPWLIDKYAKGDSIEYIFFWGHSNKSNQAVGKFVFSQWYPSPFTFENKVYKTAEHWMMAHKALLFGDEDIFRKILNANKPGEVKDLGRRITNFEQKRWDDAKFEIVRQGNIYKFNSNANLKAYLISTSSKVIVEASPTDNIWGIGVSQDAKGIENPNTWHGENLLGFAIMEARDAIST